jgi:tetratricopeptide (TPR) repeat protein
VVHRDLKPGNVMITPANDVKVLDFGLSAPAGDDPAPSSGGSVMDDRAEAPSSAQLADSAWAAGPMSVAGLTAFRSQDGAVIGTAAYMSPEQGRGEPATPASDIYSYGLVIEEVFAGRLRHEAAHVRPDGAGGPRVEHRIPTDIESLIAKLKAQAPSQRPTAEAVVERLKWIADAPRRRRRHLAVAALVILALGGLAKYTWDLSRERAAAVAARDEAERRREQAEGLIGFMVGDLRSRLTAVGRLEILDEVGKKALDYFQSVPAGSLSGEELYRRSQTMHQLGQLRQARADLSGALTAYEESLALAESVARSDPGNAEWQLGLGTSHFHVGDIKRRRSDLDGALHHFRAYQEIARTLAARDPANLDWKLELSYGHSNVAAILFDKGQLQEARELLELTEVLKAEVAVAKPGDVTIQISRANNHNRLAVILQRLGDLTAAATGFERELAIYRELTAQDPRNMLVLRRFPTCYLTLGQARRALGDDDAALASFQAAVQASRALVGHDATNADWQRDLAIGEISVGRMLLERGSAAAALARFHAARDILIPLSAKSQDRTRWRRNVAQSHFSIADALASQGRLDAALQESDAALAIANAMRESNANDVSTIRELAQLMNLRGEILRRQGALARAQQAWTVSEGLLAPLVPQATDYAVIDPYVRALVFLGRRSEAQSGFDRLAALGYKSRDFLKFWNQQSS